MVDETMQLEPQGLAFLSRLYRKATNMTGFHMADISTSNSYPLTSEE